MGVLILHYGRLEITPYDQWLADYDGDILMLASREYMERVGERLPDGDHGYRHVEAVAGYEAGGRVEARVLELARTYQVDHIVAFQEADLERAAQLRDVLGLPGQRLSSVLPFRNKVLMKDAVSAAGIPVAAYRDVECATDIVAFAREHGFPIVVKPRDSSGSVGLKIIETAAELDTFLVEELDLYGEFQPNLMVESFVDGPMCHVDGVVVNGRLAFAWPSQYLFRLATFKSDPGGRLDVTLDPDDPLTARLLEFTERVLEALPGPQNFAFHAEVFHTPDDELVLCEIACRTGGASIREVMRTLFGVDPNHLWLRAALGLPLPVEQDRMPLRPSRMSGQLVLVKRPGTVLEVPGEPPFPWVEKTNIFITKGQVMGKPTYSADFLASFVVSAPSRRDSERRMRQLETWFFDELSLGAA
jgi:biotin carboxylase